jgi:hypothetical protein
MILDNGMLYPVEIKKSALPRREDVRDFLQIDGYAESGIKRGPGALICTYGDFLPLNETDWIFPVTCL